MRELSATLEKDLALSLDPVLFAQTLGFAPEPWQARILRSASNRLLLNCHRQAGKSTIFSILGLHTALYQIPSLTLLLSPSLRQSSELFRKVLDFYAKLEDTPQLVEESRLSLKTKRGSRIISLPSTEATVRGYSGVDLLLEDEAARVPDSLYYAIRPMIATSGGRLMLGSCPYGKAGHFFHEWTQGSHWERVKVTALECPRISQAFLDEERATHDPLWFAQEYLCEFTENESQVFGYEDVMGCLSDEVQPLFSEDEALPVGMGLSSEEGEEDGEIILWP